MFNCTRWTQRPVRRFNARVDNARRNGYVDDEVCNRSPALSLRPAKTPRPSLRILTLLLLIGITSAAVPSCGVVDFVSAYFNTYYNARRLFNDAETEVISQLDARPGGRNWLVSCGV